MKLRIQKLAKNATVPSYAHATDAGLDLHATEAVTLEPGDRAGVATGIALQIPEGYVGLIWDKSGIAIKHGLKVMGGVIDAGYRGEIIIGLKNLSDKSYRFEAGDKVAQMVIQKVEQPTIELVDSLDTSDRGEGGFGSTGK